MKKNILIACAAIAAVILLVVIISISSKKTPLVWYVDEGLEKKWEQVIADSPLASSGGVVHVWDQLEVPRDSGILISFKPWETDEIVKVFHRLSWELEYEGAHVIAVDPWMIFNKHTNPGLTLERINTNASNAAGKGSILIPGRDINSVRAWTSRFIQDEPGKFPEGAVWKEWESKLFDSGVFTSNMRGYDWYAVFFRLMGNEQTWLYAPVSAIRGHRDPRKSILEASPFPERGGNENTLLARILWALPIKSNKKSSQKLIEDALSWLKLPETQTKIADTFDMLPADPYGSPYDPMSLTAHRLWLTTPWIYSIYD